MESISFQQLRIVEDTLMQIRESINNLEEWNAPFSEANDFHMSPDGVKTLAADCMLIEAIGEGIKRIDERTKGLLLPTRPVEDVVEVVGYMIGNPSEEFNNKNADVNGDGIINIADIVSIVNIIMGN